MSEISLEAITGKLNRVGYDAFIQGLRFAKKAGNRNVELAHVFLFLLQNDASDISLTFDAFKLDRAKAIADLTGLVGGLKRQETEMPGISNHISDILAKRNP